MSEYTPTATPESIGHFQESTKRWKTAGAECLHCGGSVMTLTGDRDDCRCLQCGRAPWQVDKRNVTKPGPEARASSRFEAIDQGIAASQERR